MARQRSTTDYIRGLERRIEELEEDNKALRSKIALHKGGRKHSKKELRDLHEWNESNVILSGTVTVFCKEYLFPRYKFLDDNWIENGGEFFNHVKQKLRLPDSVNFGRKWDQVIAPTIAKKYADMRCNINNACRDAFIGKSSL